MFYIRCPGINISHKTKSLYNYLNSYKKEMKKLHFQRDKNKAIKKISCKFRLPCPVKLQYLDTLENLSLYSARQQVFNLVKVRPKRSGNKETYNFIA